MVCVCSHEHDELTQKFAYDFGSVVVIYAFCNVIIRKGTVQHASTYGYGCLIKSLAPSRRVCVCDVNVPFSAKRVIEQSVTETSELK